MNRIFADSALLSLILVCCCSAQYYRQIDPFQYIPKFDGFGIPDFSYNSYQPMLPWYKGPNVCVDEGMKPVKTDGETEPKKEFLGMSIKFRSETETCKGDDETYKCIAKVYKNGVSSTRTRTYTCCKNFVRSTDGSPGCVPEAEQTTAKTN